MARKNATPLPPEAPRGPLWAALVLSLAGLGVAIALTRVHAQAHAGIASFCSISDVVNCDRVATSHYSVVLGLPVSVWGMLGYALAGGLAAWGLAARRSVPAWPTGILLLVAALAVLASVALALVSEFLIGALCILCAVSWAISAALLVAAWRACRPVGPAAAIRADLAVVVASPLRTGAFALLGMVAIAAAASAYPRYWERTAQAAAAARAAASAATAGSTGPAPARPAAGTSTAAGPSSGAVPTGPAPASRPATTAGAPARTGAVEVVVYSDYECPFCAKQHAEVKALLAGRPGVKLVHRQFPLDSSCNPLLKTQMHAQACRLARAGICAGDQGKIDEMSDLLFENQRARQPLDALARRAGLDVARFEECVASPDTARRVAEDLAAGLRDGVKGTPTYVAEGRASLGVFPVELLPPR
jgi:protein-disulfide isomerase